MKPAQIDDVLWQRARSLAESSGLVIEGLGELRGGSFTPRPAQPTGYDAPALVVRVADELGVADDEVRARLRAEVEQAVASAAGRPAPLGGLGLIEREHAGGPLRFHPARRREPAPAGAIEDLLAAWRAPADDLDGRIAAVAAAMAAVPGALPTADQRRLLDELDYDLDDDGWQRHRAQIIAALPF